MDFVIRIDPRAVRLLIEQLEARAERIQSNLDPFWRGFVIPKLEEYTQRQFDMQGTWWTTGWPDKKVDDGNPVGVRSGTMRKAATTAGAHGNRLVINGNRLTWGIDTSELEYAKWFHKGAPDAGIPARPIFPVYRDYSQFFTIELPAAFAEWAAKQLD